MNHENGRLRLLFIARSFPPTLGGMENLAFHLSESLRRHGDVTMLVNRRGKKALPAFLPYVLVSAIYLARKHRAQAIHLADALLAPLGVVLKKATGLPVTCTVHGLDVTYPNRLYQSVVPRAVARLDLTMPNSQATAAEIRARAGETTPAAVIPLGINPLPEPGPASIRAFQQQAGIGPNERAILSVGRLVRRKGIAWFVTHVLPGLPDEALLIVIGEGPEAEPIRAAAASAGVADRVRLLGRVPDGLLAAAYRSADVFVMPNIPLAGDMEGFGLVALEASASGLPVVASDLEGITEAVQHERNGLLIPPRDAGTYAQMLRRLLSLSPEQLRGIGEAFREFTMREYSWSRTAGRYVEVIEQVAARRSVRLPAAA